MLELANVYCGYEMIEVIRDVSLKVEKGEFISLVGPNGVGKTTTLRAISGLLKPSQGDVFFLGEKVTGLPPQELTRKGLSFVTEDGCLFGGMTVQENLKLGAFTIKEKSKEEKLLESTYSLFPRLRERKTQLAGTLSGGERKMLSIGRGLMCDPKLLLVDEPSLGLAPQLVSNVFDSLRILSNEGMTILLVEQNVSTALKITHRTYVLEQGEIVLEGESSQLEKNEHVRNSYLGLVAKVE